jgi:hypothetical protein
VEISRAAAGDFFWASAVWNLEAILEAQKKSADPLRYHGGEERGERTAVFLQSRAAAAPPLLVQHVTPPHPGRMPVPNLRLRSHVPPPHPSQQPELLPWAAGGSDGRCCRQPVALLLQGVCRRCCYKEYADVAAGGRRRCCRQRPLLSMTGRCCCRGVTAMLLTTGSDAAKV